MSAHARCDEETSERASAYVLGELDGPSASAYELHLEECQACRDDVAALRDAATAMLRAARSVEPPARLQDELFTRIRCREGETIARADEARWEALRFPGVSRRMLHSDSAGDRETYLLRLEPNASLPKHGHGGVEECYVLEGDVRDGALRMTAGDYSRYEKGTRHGPLVTGSGCLLLISASAGRT